MSDYRMWRLTAQVQRYHQHYHSSGRVWRVRFRAFPIQEDDHLLTVHRYIERSPVRAGLVERAQEWPPSSSAPATATAPPLDPGPAALTRNWLHHVNQVQTDVEVESLRECLRRGLRFGDGAWIGGKRLDG